MSIVSYKKKYSNLEISLENDNRINTLINEMSASEIYSILAKSIAPEIYGLEDVKKALLLLLGIFFPN